MLPDCLLLEISKSQDVIGMIDFSSLAKLRTLKLNFTKEHELD